MTVVTGTLHNGARTADTLPVSFATPVPRAGDTPGTAVSTYSETFFPVDGVLTTSDLEPGQYWVTWAGKRYPCVVLDQPTQDFWELLAASVAFPPGTSAEQVEAAVQAYLDGSFADELDTKLDKSVTHANQLYGTDAAGNQIMAAFANTSDPWTIVSRDGAGRTQVADPFGPLDAVNKETTDAAVAVAARAPIGAYLRPHVPSIAFSEAVNISWGPDPAYSSERTILWNDARSLGLIDRGANLVASGAWGTNQVVDTLASGSPFCIEFYVTGTDVAIQATPPTGNNGEYRIWVDGWEVQPPTIRAYSATDLYLKLNWSTSKTRLVRVAFGNFWYRGIVLPGAGAAAANEANRFRIAIIGDSYIQSNVAGGPGETLVAASGIAQTLSMATGADVYACGLGGSGFSKPSPAPYGDSTRMNRLAQLPAMDLIIIQGGVNDLTSGQTNTQITTALTSLLNAIAAQRPGTPIVVSGIQPVIADAGTVVAATAALKATALAHPAVRGFIDWTANPAFFTGTGNSGTPNNTGNADVFIGTDNLHPSRAGVEHIVTRTIAELRKMKV